MLNPAIKSAELPSSRAPDPDSHTAHAAVAGQVVGLRQGQEPSGAASPPAVGGPMKIVCLPTTVQRPPRTSLRSSSREILSARRVRRCTTPPLRSA
ncbi:hypothetical protein NF556_02340 [Ornithinimicrobium faecis]|uniref:Uncharacterized protein n=1 Tax=Ornithinimicrobium faecis TaxID=2934158 RepID=A0ABY4YUU9_9MICO|nr:hypothetical protein [Ornithinimicrobium sp. HY1793]USQ80527.1 hypothetical protein NF556_02340 [Ornithinimicrobium sp. HY1793]